MNKFQPTAVPLIAVDPYFSIWSFTDQLADDHTRHWTGRTQSMYGVLKIDGCPYRFMGKTQPFELYYPEGKALEQIDLTVTPTSSVYTFSHSTCQLRVTFLTPALIDRPEVLSRPVSYIFYEITEKEAGHSFEVYFDVSAMLCGDEAGQSFACIQQDGHVFLGAVEQKVLNSYGDDVRIDWGYLHLVHPNAKLSALRGRLNIFSKKTPTVRVDFTQPVDYRTMPILCATSDKLQDMFVIAYDDIHSIQYFDQQVDAYYKTVYGSFDAMLEVAVREANDLRRECAKFDAAFVEKMKRISDEYAAVGALAYRQVTAAHKLVDVNGEMMYFSKECFSGGYIGTLDVTYPSIPLYLLLNPEMVRALLRPLFAYARTPIWKFPYAPHDCGNYPFCTGQVYFVENGVVDENGQMPVEESANAILCVAAAVRADGDMTFANQHADLLEKWANYLVEYGYDPAFQLCTDDFAGRLAHNCNLSLKAIVALGAYANLVGKDYYAKVAKEMADRWVRDAKRTGGKGWRLAFDCDDTWSLKYNMVWDRLLDLNLFDPSVGNEEIDLYLEKMNRYGVPLDNRKAYTKIDWLAWTTVIVDRPDYTKKVYEAIAATINDMMERVPITDLYDTEDARMIEMQARSVLGGFYINMLWG